VAYVSTRRSFTSIYRKAWDGTGNEEQLFQYTPGAGLVLTDWSADGKFLTFHDGCSGVLHVVPLQILERGGNAIDAAIAANATISLMEPTGIPAATTTAVLS
jgi:Tol biopolymer transport system component